MLVTAYKVGRIANGAQRNSGRVIHLVEKDGDNFNPFMDAICKTDAGKSWKESPEATVTCPKCIEKQKRLLAEPPMGD